MKLRRRKALLLILARHRIKRKRKEALEKEKKGDFGYVGKTNQRRVPHLGCRYEIIRP